jgi:transketolase
MTNLELEKTANEIRKSIVTAVHSAKSGHPGGSLSSADIFTYLYFEEMNIDPKNPKMEDRDRFVKDMLPRVYTLHWQREDTSQKKIL